MDSILGKWVAYPKDFDNLPGYLKALGKAHVSPDKFEQGLEMEITKDGGDYVIARTVGGSIPLAKEILKADGTVEMVASADVPTHLIKLTHKWEGGRLIIDGTIKDAPSGSILKVDGNVMTADVTFMGCKIAVKYSKKS